MVLYDRFESEYDFEVLLDRAILNSRSGSEEDFVYEIMDKFATHKMNTYINDEQQKRLEDIAAREWSYR